MANGTDNAANWEGQARINGELCRVDWRIVQALKAVQEALAACTGCAGVNLTALTDAINVAEGLSTRVADIKPPGCGDINQQG
jgi:hypothetical protein